MLLTGILMIEGERKEMNDPHYLKVRVTGHEVLAW